MKMSQTLLTALVLTSMALTAQANTGSMASESSQTVLVCQESSGTALVTEQAKQLTIEKNSVGELTMTVVQNDSASESRILMNSAAVAEISCNGYGPCRRFVSDSIEFFINFYSSMPYQPGHLEATVHGQKLEAYFHCTQN